MTLVFDTYSRRTRMHYISIMTLIVMSLALFIANVVPGFKLSNNGLTVLGVIWFFSVLRFMTYFGFFKRYIKDGEISFSEDKIVAGSLAMSLAKVKRLVIVAGRYHGYSRGSDGGGNVVVIYDQLDSVSKYNFVIKDYLEKKNLENLIAHYSENGIPVSTNRFDT